MPVDGSLLNAPSGEELARHRLSLYRSALALAARIADVSYTSRILEAQLEDAVRFLASDDECPTAKKLNEKLSQIGILVATTEAAVDRHENQRRHSNTPPVPELSFSEPGPPSPKRGRASDGPFIIEQPEPGPPSLKRKRGRKPTGIPERRECHNFFLRYVMRRMIHENGAGNEHRFGGWSLKQLVQEFKQEYCPRQPDPQYYTSNNFIPALRDWWAEALALRCDMRDNPVESEARVEARLYTFTRMRLSDWEATSRLCRHGAAVAVSDEDSNAGGGFAEEAGGAAGSPASGGGSPRVLSGGGRAQTGIPERRENHNFFLRYAMRRMIHENGAGNVHRYGGWSLKQLVQEFKQEYYPRQPDPQYYTSNNVIPALRDWWAEALALRCDMRDNPVESAARVEARLYTFTRMKLSDWEATSRLCRRGAAVAVSGEDSTAGGGFAEDAGGAADSLAAPSGSAHPSPPISGFCLRRVRIHAGSLLLCAPALPLSPLPSLQVP
jgi:hypothetical protein